MIAYFPKHCTVAKAAVADTYDSLLPKNGVKNVLTQPSRDQTSSNTGATASTIPHRRLQLAWRKYKLNRLKDRFKKLDNRITENDRLLESVWDRIKHWDALSECTDKEEADARDLVAAVCRDAKKRHEVEKRLAEKIARLEELQAQRGH